MQGPLGAFIPMSIASAPRRLPELELHYRSTPAAPEAEIMDALLTGDHLMITPAAGEATAGPDSEPLFLIVGGSAAAQAFSCAEARGKQGAGARTDILWCADRSADIYGADRLRAYDGVSLRICTDPRRTEDNTGLSWLRAHAPDFLGSRVILAGGPGFVYAATDILLAAGFMQHELHADVYHFAPRP